MSHIALHQSSSFKKICTDERRENVDRSRGRARSHVPRRLPQRSGFRFRSVERRLRRCRSAPRRPNASRISNQHQRRRVSGLPLEKSTLKYYGARDRRGDAFSVKKQMQSPPRSEPVAHTVSQPDDANREIRRLRRGQSRANDGIRRSPTDDREQSPSLPPRRSRIEISSKAKSPRWDHRDLDPASFAPPSLTRSVPRGLRFLGAIVGVCRRDIAPIHGGDFRR